MAFTTCLETNFSDPNIQVLKTKIDSGNYTTSEYGEYLNLWFTASNPCIEGGLRGDYNTGVSEYLHETFKPDIEELWGFKLDRDFDIYREHTGEYSDLAKVAIDYKNLGFDVTNELVTAEEYEACGY